MAYWPYSTETRKKFDIERFPGRGFDLFKHRGIDDTPKIKSFDIPIIASTEGIVRNGIDTNKALWVLLYGDSDRDYFSLHLDRYAKKSGDKVRAGDIIGYMGNTGNVIPKPTPSNPYAGLHIHFEVRLKNGNRIDPDKDNLHWFSNLPIIDNEMIRLKQERGKFIELVFEVIADTLFVREERSLDSKIIGKLKKGDHVRSSLAGRGDRPDKAQKIKNRVWWKRSVSGGWVHSHYLKQIGVK